MAGVVSEQLDQSDPAARIFAEGGLGMADIARRLGRGKGGKNVHPSTVSRWATRGVLLPDGSRIQLESVSLPGGRLVSSWPAALRFLNALQLQPRNAETAPVRGPGGRLRASEKAANELEASGC
jgi:hypothetical protein